MNVCMVGYTFYETDNRVRRYAETLVREGHTVDMLALRRGADLKKEVINGVTVHRIQKRTLNEKTKWSYLYRITVFLIRSLLTITAKHLKNSYDLVHVHSVPDFEVFAAIVPKLSGAKIILDIHDIVPEFYGNKFNSPKSGVMFKGLLLIEKISCGFADHVIIANHLWEKVLTARSVRPEKCTALTNYPDDNLFIRTGSVKEKGKLVLMYPGTLIYHQGVDLAIEAFSRVSGKFPNAEFRIYGGGPEKDKLMALAKEKEQDGRIVFHEAVPLDRIARIMEEADIGVVPKRGGLFADKAFSTKTLEFISLGVPVIIPRTTIDQFYFNDRIATFFDPGNVEDLARKLERLMSDSQIRETQAANGLEFSKTNRWSAKKHIYLDLIKKLFEE